MKNIIILITLLLLQNYLYAQATGNNKNTAIKKPIQSLAPGVWLSLQIWIPSPMFGNTDMEKILVAFSLIQKMVSLTLTSAQIIHQRFQKTLPNTTT